MRATWEMGQCGHTPPLKSSYHIVLFVCAFHTLPRITVIQAVQYFIFRHPLIIIRSSLKYDPWHGGRSTKVNLYPLVGVIVFCTPATCSTATCGNGSKKHKVKVQGQRLTLCKVCCSGISVLIRHTWRKVRTGCFSAIKSDLILR